jgi:DNA alkylation damage repair protein AlkB
VDLELTPPGLLIVPSLVPREVQRILLNHLIHRDLSDPIHQTNLHLHYYLPYPEAAATDDNNNGTSFFSYPPTSPPTFTPKDPSVHKPLTIKQVLERKLHWVTLGGQYDWTNRVYPDGDAQPPPAFPPDVAAFLETLFPKTLAQAAIVNFYTPGDTMMMHRDVSEETDKGLVSLSLGCEALFMIAPNEGGPVVEGRDGKRKEYLLLRLRSGDAVYMTDESRFAWHGVPKVLKGTCPGYLEEWPAEGGGFEEWRGWMRNKRINLNVRQMRD